MTLKAVLESLGDLPEGLAEHYAEGSDGRYYLDAEGVDDLPAVRGLKAKRDELLGTVRELKDEAEKYRDIDPEKYRALMEEAEEARHRELAGEGDLDAIKGEYESKLAQIKERADRETQKAREEAEAERRAARQYFKQREITRAVTEKGGAPELLEGVLDRQVKVERNDAGEFTLTVVGADGSPRIKDSRGTTYDLSDVVEELVEHPVYGRAFTASGATGGGADQTGGSGGGGKRPRTIAAERGSVRVDPAKVLSGEVSITAP